MISEPNICCSKSKEVREEESSGTSSEREDGKKVTPSFCHSLRECSSSLVDHIKKGYLCLWYCVILFWNRPSHLPSVNYTVSAIHLSYVSCPLSYVRCQLSYVSCQLSYVSCQLSHFSCHLSSIYFFLALSQKLSYGSLKLITVKLKLSLLGGSDQLSAVSCHLSAVSCQLRIS